jgi:TatD DNase family protein
MFVDSHCHLTYEPLFSNIDDVINDCKKNDIVKLLTISTDLKTAKESILIADKYESVFCTIGIHPNCSEIEFAKFDDLKCISTKSKKIIGIGETGLDYYKFKCNKKIQIDAFLKHIDLADKLKIPVIVHNRNADDDLISIISDNVKQKSINFLIHCYTGSLEMAKKLLDLNCYISFSGIITFKKSNNLRNVAKFIPLDRMMIETDSPFLSPEPFRGKNNYPLMVKYVAKTISELKKLSIEEIAKKTTYNFNNFFLKKNEY